MTTFTVRDDREHGFAIIYDDVIHACDPYQLAVYAALMTFANRKSGQCNPSHETLAERAGMSKRKVAAALTELRSMGLIDWEKQWITKGSTPKQKSNQYWFTGTRLHDVQSSPVAPGAVSPVAPGAVSPVAPGAEEPYVEPHVEPDAQQSMFQADQPASKKRNGAKKKPAKKILDHSYRPFFEQWWEQYPRKINKAKAMVAFQDAMKAGTTNAELTTALRHYNESIAQWEAKHGEKLKWIVYPQRFISERFLDFIDGPNPDAWNAPEKPKADDEYDPEWEILGVRS